MSKYTNKFIEFLNHTNTIAISSAQDLISFKSLIKKVGLSFDYDYEKLTYLARKNNFLIRHDTVLVEYNYYKGFCLGWKSIEQSKEWFEQEPYTMKEIKESM